MTPKTLMVTGRKRPPAVVSTMAPRMPAAKMARLKATGRNELATSASSPLTALSGRWSWGEAPPKVSPHKAIAV